MWPLYVSSLCVTTLCEHSMCDHSMWALHVWALYVWPLYGSTLCVTTLCEHSMCEHSMRDHSMWALYVSTLCVTTLCEHSMCEHSMCEHSMRDHSMRDHSMCDHSMCDHSMCDHSMWPLHVWALYVWPLYVSTLCEHSMCEHSMCDHSMGELYVWPLYVSTLCVSTLCVTTLCVSTLCVTTLCEHSMCDHSMWALYVSTLCVTTLCVTTLCVTTLCEHSMREHKNTTTPTQKHHHTTTPAQKHHHKRHAMCEHSLWARTPKSTKITTKNEHHSWAGCCRTPKSTKITTKNEHQFLGRMLQNTEKYENYHEKWTSVLGPDVAAPKTSKKHEFYCKDSCQEHCRTPKSTRITTKNEHRRSWRDEKVRKFTDETRFRPFQEHRRHTKSTRITTKNEHRRSWRAGNYENLQTKPAGVGAATPKTTKIHRRNEHASTKIAMNSAQSPVRHLDLATPAFTTTVRTPSVTTLFGEKNSRRSRIHKKDCYEMWRISFQETETPMKTTTCSKKKDVKPRPAASVSVDWALGAVVSEAPDIVEVTKNMKQPWRLWRLVSKQ